MSKTIDEKIVEMQFDNKQFERNVATSQKSIADLKKGLNFEGASKGLSNISAAANKVDFSTMASGIETIQSRFSVMGAVAFTIIQNLTNKVLELGKNIANALVITPITSGFEEYELKMGAIQTIMAGTGEDLETVNKYLNELNTYADKTIYSFSDMTQNIGKFTNAGVSLDQAVAAIKGVANVAAVSGANSNEASRAMYNFAQALSAGYVKLIDWKSIELANMGTVEFKQQLIDAAVAAGTLTEAGDGMYKTLQGNTLSAAKGFNEALTDQWLTTDVLVKTLNDYADETTEIGAKATAAAQDVKTFTMLLDTLKEALQSGWAFTWELLIGDFNEAKAFFTNLSNILGGMVGDAATARNNLLEGWIALEGRGDILRGIYDSLEIIQIVAKTIKEAFHEIFPPLTAERLKEMSQSFQELVEKFKMGESRVRYVKTVFKGFFALLDIGRMFVSSLVKRLVDLTGTLSPFTSDVKDAVLSVSEWLINLRETIIANDTFGKGIDDLLAKIKPYYEKFKEFAGSIKEFGQSIIEKVKNFSGIDLSGIKEFVSGIKFNFEPLTLLWEILGKSFGILWKIIQKLAPSLLNLATAAGKGISGFLDKISEGLDNFDANNIFNTINSGLFAGILLAIRNFIKSGGGIFDGVSEVLEGVGGALEAWQANLKSNVLLKIAAAIAILALSIVAIGSVDADKVAISLGAMTVLILELFGAMKAFAKIGTGVKGLATMTAGVLGIATALLLISVAVRTLALLDPNGLVRGVAALGVIILLMRGAAENLSRTSGKVIRGATALTIMAGALILMSGAVYVLGKIDPEVLTQGLIGLGVLLSEVGVFISLVGGKTGIVAAAVGIYVLAAAMLLLTAPIFLLGSMKFETLQQGLMAMGASLLIVAGAMHLMPKNMIFTAVGLAVVAQSLLLLAASMRILGGMDPEQMKVALIGLGASLAIIALGLYAMSGTLVGSAALLVAAVAIGVLAVALKALGGMSLKEIGLALLAIVGVLTVLGIAAAILTPLIPSLLGLAAALFIFGAAAALTGVGILALSVGLAALAGVGAAGISALVVALSAVISLIPFIAVQVGKALISLIQTIAQGGPELLKAIVDILLLLIDGVIQVIPPLVEAILLLVTTLLENLAAALPDIIQAGYDILIALLEGIRDNIGDIITTAYDIVIEFMDAVGKKLPEVVDAGFEMMINFIDGLAESAEKNIPRLAESVRGLGKAVVNGVLEGIGGGIGELVSGIWNLGETVISTFKQVLGISSPSKEMAAQGKYSIDGLTQGIIDSMPKALRATKDVGTNIVQQFKDVTGGLSSTIEADMSNDIKPKITPVVDLSNVDACAADMQKKFKNKEDLCPLASTKTASSVAGTMSAPEAPGKPDGVNPHDSKQNTIQYVQNNYSPKALSRIEIYRNTKNQLSSAIKMT